MNKIAFIITTFMRDELLFKSVESLLPYMQDNWSIVIVDQGNMNENKFKWLDKNNFSALNYHCKRKPQQLFYYQVPFDSGLSFCRNYGVQKAKEDGCEYCVISSDSFLMNASILNINNITLDRDLIGFELEGCKCGWEGELSLLETKGFEIDFIDKNKKQIRYDISICRNFFIAKTEALSHTKWDNNLKLCEHEDFFWRFWLNNYKCVWANFISATKMTDRPDQYAKLRKENFDEGMKYLRKKWNIKGWVIYKNLERAKQC